MQTVVIFGAKPAAILPAGDAIYAANAAIMGREAEAGAFAERISVASGHVLSRGLGRDADPLYRRKFETVRDSGFRRLVLFADQGKRDLASGVLAALGGTHPDGQRLVSVRESRDLVTRIGQCGYPVLDETFRRQPPRIVLRDWVEIRRARLNWLLGNGKEDVRAKYRPSTGILALLVAISEKGPDAHYILSGIGLAGRNEFLVDGRILRNKSNSAAVLPKHVQADTILLRALARRYSLSTTEAELQDILPATRISR